jgi:leader peptidase (prepilin peptidase)/N-methyltransferase
LLPRRYWPLRSRKVLSGKCPSCRSCIGPPPASVEASLAATLGVIGATVTAGPPLAAAAWLAVCAVPLAWIDWADRRLPNPLTAMAYAGTAGWLLVAAATGGQWPSLTRALIGGAVLGGLYALPAVFGSVGAGDAKLAASLGTALAWPGWATLITGAAAGFAVAAPYAAAQLMSRRGRPGGRMPFAPFMVAGTFLVVALTGMHP